jgi:starch synthase
MLSKEYGAGLENFLKTRREYLSGILNGLDVSSFDPATDEDIAEKFSVETLNERKANKLALTSRVGLSYDPTVPLFGVVSRLELQKGIDLVLEALRKFGDAPWQAVLLGTGDSKLEESARKLAAEFPERVHFEARYDARLARLIYAGTDIFLMPSRYEPCGLSQMIAMRYGCVPVVRAVGGLHDTVTDGETGFVFIQPKVKDFTAALQRAVECFKDEKTWRSMQIRGMSQDFSWTNSALKYVELYKRLLSRAKVPLP